MANNMKPETMLMSGVPVDFPHKPYPCQVAMLGRIIKALQQSKNCLLESPTGTGKTLTLLCAALAWQQKELEQLRTSVLNDPKDTTAEAASKPTSVSRIFYCTRTHKQLEQVAKQLSNTIYKDKIRMTLLSSRDNYCVHPVVSKGPNKNHECNKLTRFNKDKPTARAFETDCSYYDRTKGKLSGDLFRSGSKSLPRVFDIEQFTEYCRVNHGICPYFTSRLLINDVQLVLCPYNYLIDPRVRNSMQIAINNSIIIIDEAHNIEDCARESMKFEMRKYDFEQALTEICANEKALEMAQIKAAQLVVDASGFSSTQEPLSSTGVTSTQESSGRRAFGYSEYDKLLEEADLLEHLNIDQHGHHHEQANDSVDNPKSAEHEVANALKFLSERFSRMILWFDTKNSREKYTFTPKELVEEFHHAKFIDQSLINVHKPTTKNQPATKCRVVQDAGRIRKALAKCCFNGPEYLKYSDETGKFLENFDLCLSILYADDYSFVEDYKIALKTVPFEPSESVLAQMQARSEESVVQNDLEWTGTHQKPSQFKRNPYTLSQTTYPLHTQQLTFYCLSPSVAFAKDLRLVRSLIFASGTLAPLATYAGELKLPFDIQMECNHVIDIDRTFITALSHGRNPNLKLRATYQNTDKIEFQDECGLIVLDICQRVPHGILCFVPSYRFLNVITNRWMTSGLWQKLNEYKSVFFEEKGSATFQNTIERFREANGTFKIVKPLSNAAKQVKAMFKRNKKTDEVPANSPYCPVKGGLLLAVCRGRASEGIDFSDDNARCVITLGIPYPNVQDEEVNFKRSYNNEQNKRMAQVMNGSDWYDSQAYRALNQALGRCIRHKNDWGALFIVEERIVNNIFDTNFNNKISLWIKQRLTVSRNYEETMAALENFVANMRKVDELEMFERQQREFDENAEQKPAVQEEKPLIPVAPPSKDAPHEKKQTKPVSRQWKVDDLDEHGNNLENERKEITKRSFERYFAARQFSMPPPPIPPEKVTPCIKEEIVDPTNDGNQINAKHIEETKSTPMETCPTQKLDHPCSLPVLSQNTNSTKLTKIIDLTNDDDDSDDFIESVTYSSRKSFKKFKLK